MTSFVVLALGAFAIGDENRILVAGRGLAENFNHTIGHNLVVCVSSQQLTVFDVLPRLFVRGIKSGTGFHLVRECVVTNASFAR